MHKKYSFLSGLIVLISGTFGCSMAMGPTGGMQGMMQDTNKPVFLNPFSVVYKIAYDKEAFPYIEIYYNVPYSKLTFLKADSLYHASFTLNSNIKHEGETIINKSVSENLRMSYYPRTISKEESFFGTFKENISTGENEIFLFLMDKNSNRRYIWKRKILVPEVSDTLRQD